MSSDGFAPGYPDWLMDLSREMAAQDNRCTSDPMFDVERLVYDQVDERCEPSLWMVFDHQACESEGPFEERPEETPTRSVYGVAERWEHVTSCFTEAAAQRYIERHKHRGPMRVWVSSLCRNPEMKRVRQWLLDVATSPRNGGES